MQVTCPCSPAADASRLLCGFLLPSPSHARQSISSAPLARALHFSPVLEARIQRDLTHGWHAAPQTSPSSRFHSRSNVSDPALLQAHAHIWAHPRHPGRGVVREPVRPPRFCTESNATLTLCSRREALGAAACTRRASRAYSGAWATAHGASSSASTRATRTTASVCASRLPFPVLRTRVADACRGQHVHGLWQPGCAAAGAVLLCLRADRPRQVQSGPQVRDQTFLNPKNESLRVRGPASRVVSRLTRPVDVCADQEAGPRLPRV